MNRKVTIEDITLEKDVAQTGRQWLELIGWKVHRVNADRWKGGNNRLHEREEPGTPDYIATYPMMPQNDQSRGMYWAFRWEAKRTKRGVIRETQRDWAKANPKELVTYAKSLTELQAFVMEYFPHMVIGSKKGITA